MTDEHCFARWQDVQESRTAGIAGCDDDQETRVVDVAVFMISNGRWPERVLQPVLESILVHCDPEHQPEVSNSEKIRKLSYLSHQTVICTT